MEWNDVLCKGCGAVVRRPAKEVRRQRKRDPDAVFFCGRACFANARGQGNLGAHLGNGSAAHLDPGNRRDPHSPFRYFLRKARNRPQADDLDLEYLEALWQAQGGRCALSGVELELPPTSLAWEQRTGDPWKPSLDRIDSSQGYVRGNVRFVAMIANQAKGRFSDADVIALARAIVAVHGEG